MRFGTNFAQAIENRLKGEPIPKFDAVTDATVARFLDAAETYFPTEPQEGIFAERKIQFAMPSVNATMIGYIDVLDLTGPVARIRDHKTRSDKRYAPNFDKLTTDLQLNIYAYAIRHEGLTGSEGMSIGHINYIKPPKAKAADLAYLATEWQPEVFAREIPLDTERNELIMGGVKDEVAVMASLADPNLPASDVPLDTTGEACYSYGQPCPYSMICPKVSLRFSPFTPRTAMSLPPPPPSRTAAPSALAPASPQTPRNAPPPPPSRAAAPAPQGQKNLPPPPPSRAAAPAPSLSDVSPPAAVSLLAASEAIAEEAVFSMGMAAASASSGGINPPSDGIMPVVPVSSIPNITAATKAWLAEHRFTNSLQVANLTEQYLLAVKAKKGTTTELLKAADVLRGLHGVEAPNAFDYCPPLDGTESEPESTAASMLADLPDHPPATASAPVSAAPARARKPAKAAVVATEGFEESDEEGEVVYPPPAPKRAPVIVQLDGRRPPLTLYLECSPLKGAEFVTLEEWLAPLIEQIERNNGVTSWRAITEFGRFNALLHAGVAQIINGTAPSEFRLPQHLVVLSIYSDYAKAIIDLLINRATLVVSK